MALGKTGNDCSLAPSYRPYDFEKYLMVLQTPVAYFTKEV